jgi:hypothetical protein
MLAEDDFSNGVRGKYAAQFAHGSQVVILDSGTEVTHEISRLD